MSDEKQPSPADEATTAEPSPCPGELERRGFFMKLTFALSAVIGAIMTLPLVGYILAPVFGKHKEVWRSVGEVKDFKPGTTVLVSYEDPSPEKWAGVTAESGAWVRCESEGEFTIFSINCRHLGCPVRWVDGAGLFMCPCHGGVYYSDGTVAGGPPPEPLHRMKWQITDGNLEIRTGPIPLTLFEKSLS